jgi:hypothetical protein
MAAAAASAASAASAAIPTSASAIVSGQHANAFRAVDTEALLRDPAFLLPSIDADRVVCFVCMLILKEPANIECGHTACRTCLSKGYCVTCMAVLPPLASITINYELQRVVSKVLRKCPHPACADVNGVSCDLAGIKEHLNHCKEALFECLQCHAHVPQRGKVYHLEEQCIQRRVACTSCGFLFTSAALEVHKKTSAVPVNHRPDILEFVRKQPQKTEGARIKQEEKEEDSAGAASRGCSNMMVCAAECVDPTTGLPWMFSVNQQRVHHTLHCSLAEHHCDTCCSSSLPRWIKLHEQLPAICTPHVFVGQKAFAAHLLENVAQHMMMQQIEIRRISNSIVKLPIAHATHANHPLVCSTFNPSDMLQPNVVRVSLTELRMTCTTGTRSQINRLGDCVVQIMRRAYMNHIIIAVSHTSVTQGTLSARFALLLPHAIEGDPANRSFHFEMSRGAILPPVAVFSASCKSVIVWQGTWEQLAPWMTSNRQVGLVLLKPVASSSSPPPPLPLPHDSRKRSFEAMTDSSPSAAAAAAASH